jgi:hypothetical protein
MKLNIVFQRSEQNSSTSENIPRLVWNARDYYDI